MAPKFIIPEVIEPDAKLPADLVALRRFAYLMDEAVAIPGMRRRIGIDAAVGLIPGVGALIGGLLSAWIVISAVRHRVPLLHVSRMMANILIDISVGSIPLIGDIFDWLFEENVMNLTILLRHRNRRRPPRTPGQMIGFTTAILLIVVMAGILCTAALVILAIWLAGHR